MVQGQSPQATTRRIWPAFRSLQGYGSRYLSADLVAGLNLAAIAIPAQMATAHLAGFPPQIGFFAFLAGTIGFAAFGDNHRLCACADSTIAPIFSGSLTLIAAAGTQDYALLCAALALLVGAILVAAGAFRLGRISDLLSIPVTVGFLAGIAAHIIFSQLPDIFGTAPPQDIAGAFAAFAKANPFTLAIAFGELAAILFFERLSARIPAALIGLIVATCAVLLFRLETHGVAVLGEVPNALPTFGLPARLPAFDLEQVVPLALIIAIVIMVQTAATTRSFPSDPDKPPDIDRDFVGVGAGSLVAGLFGAFPVDASPPSTEIVVASGGRSQLACLIASLILLVLLLFGTSLLRHVPQAALAGVLLFVALKIIRFDRIAIIYRQSFPEFLLIIATAAAIIVLPIEQGVAIGIGLSLVHGIWSMASGTIVAFERVPGTSIWWPPQAGQRGETLAGVAVLGFDAPLSFLNADRFHRQLTAATEAASPKLIVLEATSISEIDFTAAEMLKQVIRECRAGGAEFAIARLESVRAQEAVRRFRIEEALSDNRIFHSVDEAVKVLAKA